MQKLFMDMIMAVVTSLEHNWIPLSAAMLVAALMKVYVDIEKLKALLLKKAHVSIWASVGFGAFTPLCACGTMALVIGMLTTTLPWGSIMAFLTSSPLMSPDGFILLSGIIGLKFAVAVALASVIIGLGSGYITHIIEKRTSFLNSQTRFTSKAEVQSCSCAAAAPPAEPGCCGMQLYCAAAADNGGEGMTSAGVCCRRGPKTAGGNVFFAFIRNIKWYEIDRALLNIGIKQILLFYMIFVAIGFLINSFVPTEVIVALFSTDNMFAVPLASLIGLPVYISGEASIPLIKVLMAGGAGGGAMLAFLITGPGTSAWVIAGISTFLKKRAVLLYVMFLLAGGVILGYLYDMLLLFNI
jgi:uncharacterized membrane protein YraQ (UPF0718 family)